MSKIKTIKPSTIRRALRLHQEWLDSKGKYKRKGRQLHPTTEAIRKTSFNISDFGCANFSYADFSNLDFSNLDFYLADFHKANFRHAFFDYANFSNTNFSNASFFFTDFSNAIFFGTNFKGANFKRAAFCSAKFNKAIFEKTIFDDTSFYRLDLDNTDFQGAIFQDVSWKNTDFRHMLMKNVLTANLEGLTVIQCQFEVSGNQNKVLQYWVEPQIFVDGTGKTFPSLSAFQRKIEKMKEDGVFDSFDSPDGEYDYKVYQSAIKYISDLSELYQKQK